MKNNKALVIVLIVLAVVIVFAPLFIIGTDGGNIEYAGTDGQGGGVIAEIQGVEEEEVEPWFTPIMETLIGGELPGEMESLLFSIQTGIGVGILAYCFGYLVARKKYNLGTDAGSPSAQ
ncbi:MAG TPA: cobalt ABC transporter [Coriobacteriia bacterium]|nr:cobalt ABC transporter [Coriobacteriia bacterium]